LRFQFSDDDHFSFAAFRTTADVNTRQPEHHFPDCVFYSTDDDFSLADQFSDEFQGRLFFGVGEKAAIADFHKPSWQHMEQKTTDEFMGINFSGIQIPDA
jgi:hypothetical protein